jgi:hypothetical protein
MYLPNRIEVGTHLIADAKPVTPHVSCNIPAPTDAANSAYVYSVTSRIITASRICDPLDRYVPQCLVQE